MKDFVGRAREYVTENYPRASAAFLGGSAASGDATETSDLDILIVLPEQWSSVSFVETTIYERQLVEAFVYGPGALRSWLEKGRADARPVLDRLVAQGVPLIVGAISDDVVSQSRRALKSGPTPMDTEQLNLRRYTVSSLIDDIVDAEDPGLRDVVMSTAWKEAAELALLSRGWWIGTGKWLLRELRAHDDPFGLAAWVDRGRRDAEELVEKCRALLDTMGGHYQAGYIRGVKPKDL